jgi:hypothetical protein
MKLYLLNVALGLDMFVSAICGGKPGETLSGRAGSAYQQGKIRGKIFAPIINLIMGNNPHHCVGAIQGDILRAEAVIADQGAT